MVGSDTESRTESSKKRSPKTKRKQRAKLYSFNRALRSNNLLNEELKHSHATIEKRKERRNQITNHVKKVVSMSTRHVTSTNSWMSNHLNRCLLVLERGRHMQVTKPYYHAPGKPLTPYHTKRERQRLAEEEVNAKNIKEQSGIFLRFREPKRFSAGRDNCHVIELNNQLKFKAEK